MGFEPADDRRWPDTGVEPWRSRGERSAALSLLLTASDLLPDAEPEPEGFHLHDGLEPVQAGDLHGALAFVTAWEAELHAAPADEEPDADQLHASNIIRGWVHLLRGEPDGAVDCLRAAGRVGGSAVLCSFGPNLTLAWELMSIGRGDEALAYFQDVQRFWSPRR